MKIAADVIEKAVASEMQDQVKKFVSEQVRDDVEILFSINQKENLCETLSDLWENEFLYTVQLSTGEWSGTYIQKIYQETLLGEEIYDALMTEDEEAEATLEEDLNKITCAEPELQEILEFWTVSINLWEALKESGEPVVKYGHMHIWGRTTSGQAIHSDAVIEKIFEEWQR